MDIDDAVLVGGPLDGMRLRVPIPDGEKYPTQQFHGYPRGNDLISLVWYSRTAEGVTTWKFAGYRLG
jgi:hypothetical protein